MIRRVASARVDELGMPAADDGQLGALFPRLHEYLTATTFDGGEVRTPATLTLFAEAGVWKICLNDRSEQRTAWVTSGDITSAVERLEAQLESGQAEWRVSKPFVRKAK